MRDNYCPSYHQDAGFSEGMNTERQKGRRSLPPYYPPLPHRPWGSAGPGPAQGKALFLLLVSHWDPELSSALGWQRHLVPPEGSTQAGAWVWFLAGA